MKDLICIDLMCHALGFNPRETRKNQRKYEYYRNNYVVKDDEHWNYLVEIGFARKVLKHEILLGNYYIVTNEGIKHLEKIYKINFVERR